MERSAALPPESESAARRAVWQLYAPLNRGRPGQFIAFHVHYWGLLNQRWPRRVPALLGTQRVTEPSGGGARGAAGLDGSCVLRTTALNQPQRK